MKDKNDTSRAYLEQITNTIRIKKENLQCEAENFASNLTNAISAAISSNDNLDIYEDDSYIVKVKSINKDENGDFGFSLDVMIHDTILAGGFCNIFSDSFGTDRDVVSKFVYPYLNSKPIECDVIFRYLSKCGFEVFYEEPEDGKCYLCLIFTTLDEE
ncbi:MAG: hypothetical protein IJ809_00055 [Clostridia bacterium]|nr:hypothetical protein [Clostridia bacterium]